MGGGEGRGEGTRQPTNDIMKLRQQLVYEDRGIEIQLSMKKLRGYGIVIP